SQAYSSASHSVSAASARRCWAAWRTRRVSNSFTACVRSYPPSACSRCFSRRHTTVELIEQRHLTWQQLPARFRKTEPGGAVHFGIFAALVRKRIARDAGRIGIAAHGPGVHDLPALLSHRRQSQQLAIDGDAGLFGQLAPSSREGLLICIDLALRDGPGAIVFARPERAAGVHEKHLEHTAPLTKHEHPSTLHHA